jgi:hypothetical protein
MNEERPKVPLVRLLLAWGFVGIPLVWGVYQTIVKASALFAK